ncbi:MAG TPA: PDZ domain-containing protein [Thermoanaerobaculia bacterium]|nr:PDZ domain-containing protein [Thermoanaerobaculia bacterium]
MRVRNLQVLVAIVSLFAVAAHADDRKKCTTPPAECERIIRQMLSGRRYLGVQIVELNPGLAVKSIVEDSPAERAGFIPGDRLMAVNGTSTKDASIDDFKKILSEASKTGRLWMIVQRHGILKPVEARMEPYTKAQIDKIVAQHLAEAHGIGAAPAQR